MDRGDADPCTDDACEPPTGCVSTPTTAACDDGDPATWDDVCDGAGACAGGPYTCAPSPCEATSAPNGAACDVTWAATGTPCDDGDPATSGSASTSPAVT